MRSEILKAVLATAVLVSGLTIAIFVYGSSDPSKANGAFTAPNMEPLTYNEARAQFFRLAPELLLVVYDAFGRIEEDDIYDTLALVADGDALEQLYLERIGAMKGGGLEEADQTIHEIKLLSSSLSGENNALVIDASWQVIGTVGHAEHMHVRGNTYSADLTIEPVDGAWKITDFTLRDVNRDAAGETFLAPEDS